MSSFGYLRVVEAFDKNEVAGSFLREDGEGGLSSGVLRMADEITRLRTALAAERTATAVLREATNQRRLAFAGYVSVRSALDKLDAIEPRATPEAER